MKVLMITSRADIGGGPKHVLELLRQNKKESRVTYFMTSPTNQSFSEEFQILSEKFMEVPFRSFTIKSFFKVLFFCLKNKIKIIHSHGRGAGIYSRILKLFGFKVVHTFHGIHQENGFVGKTKFFVDILLSHFTDKFICVSLSERENAVKSLVTIPEKTFVVENGVPIPGNFITRPWQTPPVAGVLARLDFAKGIDILLERMLYLQSISDLPFTLLIAGDGDLRDVLEKKVIEYNLQDKVKFLGEVNPDEGFWSLINFFISSSRWEGLPLAVIEAFSRKIPCCLSEVSGNKDLAENGEALLYSLDSREDFAAKVHTMIKDNRLREIMVQKALERIQSKNNVNTMYSNTIDIYRSLGKTL